MYTTNMYVRVHNNHTTKNNVGLHELFIISGNEGRKYKIFLVSVVNNSIEILNLIYIDRLYL